MDVHSSYIFLSCSMTGGVEMSMRNPAVSIAVSAPDLKLPSDEELAKRKTV